MKRWLHRLIARLQSQKGISREFLSRRYLRGSGLEIGALHDPLPVSSRARVRYVDRMSVSDLRLHYPELRDLKLVEPDIIDNGETLASIGDQSQDFVVANHFLEHTEDPIGTLKTFLRVLRPGGILYIALPNKTETFDRERPVTPFEHLVADHIEGPSGSRKEHFKEWVKFVDPPSSGESIEAKAKVLDEKDYSIHFHVWDESAMLELVFECNRKFKMNWQIEVIFRTGHEVILLLKKQ